MSTRIRMAPGSNAGAEFSTATEARAAGASPGRGL